MSITPLLAAASPLVDWTTCDSCMAAFIPRAGHMVPVEQPGRRQQDVPVRLHRQRADATGLRRLRVPAARGRHVRRACLHAGGGHRSQASGTGGLVVAPRRSPHVVVGR